MPDLVHLVVEVNPQCRIRGRHQGPVLAAFNSCFVATVGRGPRWMIKRNVENQRDR